MNKTRPFTLTAGIVNIVFATVDIIGMIFALTYLSYLMRNDSGFSTVIAASVFGIAFCVTIIVLSIILLTKSSLPVEKFDKFSGLIIALFVFNCLAIVSSLINIILGQYFSILLLFVYGMSATFLMIDLCLNKKEKSKIEQQDVKVSYAPQTQRKISAEKQSATNEKVGEKLVEKYSCPISKLHQSLKELKVMKDTEIISEEDYKKLKNKIIEKFEF